MVLFLVANCSLISKMYKFCCLEVNIKNNRLNWTKFGEIWKFHIFWPYLTSSGWKWPSNNKICTFLVSASNLQLEKVPHRYIGQLQFLTFIWEFSIFKASKLPTNLKKIKYASIDFTSHHSFLRVRRDHFLTNCKKKHTLLHMPICSVAVIQKWQKLQNKPVKIRCAALITCW
jgi:hypothetical protein